MREPYTRHSKYYLKYPSCIWYSCQLTYSVSVLPPNLNDKNFAFVTPVFAQGFIFLRNACSLRRWTNQGTFHPEQRDFCKSPHAHCSLLLEHCKNIPTSLRSYICTDIHKTKALKNEKVKHNSFQGRKIICIMRSLQISAQTLELADLAFFCQTPQLSKLSGHPAIGDRLLIPQKVTQGSFFPKQSRTFQVSARRFLNHPASLLGAPTTVYEL